MTDPYLTLASAGGSMQSNEVSSTGVGVEVKAGVTGFGLPPVELNFEERMGEGARLRGSRVQQRSVDLKFHAYGPDRASLRSTMDRISMILAHKVTLTFHDPDANEEWSISGYRSGGGDYAYGDADPESGSDGYSWCNLMVTIVTESPYWDSGKQVAVSRDGAGNLTVTNTGTQSSPPVFIVRGPSQGFTATSAAGEVLEVTDHIGRDTVLTIDCATGTVTDNYGANRYGDLAPLPKFFHIPLGTSTITIDLDQQSQEYLDAFGAGRRNYLLNPSFTTGIGNWTQRGWGYDATNKRIVQTNTGTALPKGWQNRPLIQASATGLTPGKNYIAIVKGAIWPRRFAPGSRRHFTQMLVADGGGGVLGRKTVKRLYPDKSYIIEFTAKSATANFKLIPDHAVTKSGKFQRSDGWISHVYIGEPGAYFDGNTPDNAQETFEWTGTVGASQSTARSATIPTTGAGVTVSFNPRKWLVI